MVREREILEVIVSEFPHLNEEISGLFEESTSFIEICEDYALCLKSIKKAERTKKIVGDEVLIELKTLRLELKKELLSRI